MSRSVSEKPVELTGESLALVQAFKAAYRSVDRRKGRETHKLGGSTVSQSQFELLVELRKNGPLAVGELAQSLGLSAASVSQMVDRLSEQGHVERVRSDEDRRVVRIGLSAHGQETLDPIIDTWRKRWLEALDGMPDEDLATASRVLERIASVYDEPGEPE